MMKKDKKQTQRKKTHSSKEKKTKVKTAQAKVTQKSKKLEPTLEKKIKVVRSRRRRSEIKKEESVITNISSATTVLSPPSSTSRDVTLSEPTQEEIIIEKIIPKKEQIPTVLESPAPPKPITEVEIKELELNFPIPVKDLAVKLQQKPSELIKNLMEMGLMVNINQALEEEIVTRLAQRLGFRVKRAPTGEEALLRIHRQPDSPELLRPRPPVVTLMGHVDHGKTSLLDAIRKTKIAESEYGGITQHIGAYHVCLPHGIITFLDTPGHEAFTAMRARGARITDIVVLVVAADDGVMPQTIEAIDHARAANVPIIVAINKIDKPQANIERVKKQLSELGLTPEEWGGKTIMVGVSAKTQEGIDELLEMILLEAQMLELKANPNRLARGVVIEAKLSRGRGPVATLLVQNGTLHLNENIVVGKYYGKIRAMFSDRGQSVVEAGPSFPVEVLGITGVPEAGEEFFVIEDERKAKELASLRQEKEKLSQIRSPKRINLEELYTQIKEGKLKELKLIIKADVHGSLEAIKEVLSKLSSPEIKLDIIHAGVGSINASDAILAVASDALILGFNVTIDDLAKQIITKEGLDVRTYNVIYELSSDIKQALEGMLEPKLKKIFLGRAEIKKVFKLSRAGTVAGCFVNKGKITRNALINLVRNGQVIFEGSLSSLKRFKDDVREVQEGFECGMTFSGFEDIREGDIVEAYQIEKIARKL